MNAARDLASRPVWADPLSLASKPFGWPAEGPPPATLGLDREHHAVAIGVESVLR